MFALKECKVSFREPARVRLVVVLRSESSTGLPATTSRVRQNHFTSLGVRAGEQ